MKTALDTLPDDVETLRAMLAQSRVEASRSAELERRNAELEAANAQLDKQVTWLAALTAKLQAQLKYLKRLKHGKASEKLAPEQLALALEDVEQTIAQLQAEHAKADPGEKARSARERRASRPSLPDHLPRVEVVIEPDSTACPCCAGAMHQIGEDSSSRLDKIPAQFRVLVTRRPKYACRSCEGQVVQAPAPARLIEGGLPTEALVADVLVAKHADHTPIYRQVQAWARQGVVIDRSVPTSWAGAAGAELTPVWKQMRGELLARDLLFVDETYAKILDPGRGCTKTGYFWTVASDQRGWNGPAPPGVVYTYFPTRAQSACRQLLEGYEGLIQVDGYGAYKAIARERPSELALAHCWSHVRRSFFDLQDEGPVAREILQRISRLYAIEARIRGSSAAERLDIRSEHSRQMVDDLHAWAQEELEGLWPKARTAEALRYMFNHWDGLIRFLDDGRIELDTNPVERAMRPIALSRKNSLFAGSDGGAQNWAVIASLIESCKLNGVNPQAYLTDVLTKLVNLWPNNRIAELTPWAWAAQNR